MSRLKAKLSTVTRNKLALIAIALVGLAASLVGAFNLYDHFRGTPESTGERPYLYGYMTVESCVSMAETGFNCIGSFRQHGGDMPSIKGSMVRVEKTYRKNDLIEVFGKYDAFMPDPYGTGETPTHVKLIALREWRMVKHSLTGITLTVAGAVLVGGSAMQLIKLRHATRKASKLN